MTSIKVKYRPSSVGDREGAIYYQIIHDRKVRQLNTGYHVLADEWDESRSMVTAGHNIDRKSLISCVCFHSYDKIPKALTISQLPEYHRKQLIPTCITLDILVASVLIYEVAKLIVVEEFD